ncbi:MAG: restriction endonuclease subunit S [Bacilli bacterium]
MEGNNNKKPKIRFKGFTDAWEQCRLEEVFIKGGSGGTPKSTNKAYYDGKIPFLGISDISKSNGYIYKTEKYITEEGLNNSSTWIVPTGSISLAMYASVGKLAILNTDVTTSQAFYNMVFDNNNLRDFIYHRLSKSYDSEEWRKLVSTGTQPNLNAEKVKKFKISIPTNKVEIAMISNFFMKTDNLITLHQRKCDKLKELKKTLLSEIFPRNGENTPNLRFGGFTDAWEQRRLRDILIEFSEKSKKENEYKVLSSTNIGMELRDGRVSGQSNVGYKIIDNGDLVLSPQNLWLGNININNIGKGLVSPSYKTFKFKDIDSNFIKPQLRTSKMMESYKNASTQGASVVRRNLDIDLFQQIIILIPTQLEQRRIGTFFWDLDNLITLHQRMHLLNYISLDRDLIIKSVSWFSSS